MKKKKSLLEIKDDRQISHDFRLRSSTLSENYRPVSYTFYYGLEKKEMMPQLEQHIALLFKGEVDEGNSDMLDDVILAQFKNAIADLQLQQVSHKDTVQRLKIKRRSDKQDLEQIRRHYVEELEAIQLQLDELNGGMKNEKE